MGHIAKLETPKPPPFPLTHDVFLHEINKGREYQKENNFQLPHDKFWKYMEYRYDIAPHRFTHFHPTVGHMIGREHAHAGIPITPIIPSTPTTPDLPFVPAVPGPSSFTLMAIGLVCLGLYMRFHRGPNRSRGEDRPHVQIGNGPSFAGRSHN